MKNEKKSNNNNKYFLYFTYMYKKSKLRLKAYLAYLKKLSSYCYICITAFLYGRLLEMR